jgi:hypothetical protein
MSRQEGLEGVEGGVKAMWAMVKREPVRPVPERHKLARSRLHPELSAQFLAG